MSTSHRAKPELWEATQHAHADVSRLSDAEREQMAQELANPERPPSRRQCRR